MPFQIAVCLTVGTPQIHGHEGERGAASRADATPEAGHSQAGGREAAAHEAGGSWVTTRGLVGHGLRHVSWWVMVLEALGHTIGPWFLFTH